MEVTTLLRATAFSILPLFALGVCVPVEAGPQPTRPPPYSAERISKELRNAPAKRLRLDVQTPVATFKTSVEREYMLPFKEQLHKEFELDIFQRQSQDWSSRCCGLDIIGLAKSVSKALTRYEERKIQREVARELAQVEAAAKK